MPPAQPPICMCSKWQRGNTWEIAHSARPGGENHPTLPHLNANIIKQVKDWLSCCPISKGCQPFPLGNEEQLASSCFHSQFPKFNRVFITMDRKGFGGLRYVHLEPLLLYVSRVAQRWNVDQWQTGKMKAWLNERKTARKSDESHLAQSCILKWD